MFNTHTHTHTQKIYIRVYLQTLDSASYTKQNLIAHLFS